MNTAIRDQAGRVIAYRQETGASVTYIDLQGRLFARYINGKTYDANNRVVGTGDLGMMLAKR